jgi:hypothetical protein
VAYTLILIAQVALNMPAKRYISTITTHRPAPLSPWTLFEAYSEPIAIMQIPIPMPPVAVEVLLPQ